MQTQSTGKQAVGSVRTKVFYQGRGTPFHSQIPSWCYANQAESFELTYGEVARVTSDTFAWMKTKKARAVNPFPKLKGVHCYSQGWGPKGAGTQIPRKKRLLIH